MQKASDTNKQITLPFRRSAWLNSLLSMGTISTGGLSIFLAGTILGTKPAQANMNELSTSLPAEVVAEEPANPSASEHKSLTNSREKWEDGETPGRGDAGMKRRPDAQMERREDFTSQLLPQRYTSQLSSSELTIAPGFDPAVGNLRPSVSTSSDANLSPISSPVTSSSRFTPKRSRWDTEKVFSVQAQPAPPLRRFSKNIDKSPDAVEPLPIPSLSLKEKERSFNSVKGEQGTGNTEQSRPMRGDLTQVTFKQVTFSPPVGSANVASVTEEAPKLVQSSGGASLLGGKIQAQSSGETKQESPSGNQNSLKEIDPLAPTLNFQGVYLYQDDSSARARLTGVYPVSPNAMFGGTVDLTTGNGFSDSPGGGLQLSELYFTGSLPSLPSLRLTTGLVDLTSYFDRNSFAKDATTHFFNPVFQTNPALAATGISSRPALLLNWDVTDNIQARVAAFSSYRNLGDFAVDGFASEAAFRLGNGIIRGTFASDRDAGRNSGFKEVYGISRGNGSTGLLPSDRENSYGINGEYFIPQIKMGLFGRYGWYENTSLGMGGDTYSLGLNFLDLFRQDDRLGLGYGRDLSNDSLRSRIGAKVPDVWELFYDLRVFPNLRAGVTLQVRNEFSDVVAGFRVKTDWDLSSLVRR